MTTIDIRAGADYADALIVARKAKLILFVLLAGSLVIQLSFFFFLRYPQMIPNHSPEKLTDHQKSLEIMQYFTGGVDFVGLIGSILYSLVILLLLNIQLAARVIGVARVTYSFVLSLLLALLLFPWQAVLNNPGVGSNPLQSDLGMKIPGVLYTWAEVTHPKMGAGFVVGPNWAGNALHWARYVGFPLVTLILLGVIQIRSSRGIRESLSGRTVPATTPVD